MMYKLTEEAIEQESVDVLKEHGLDILTQIRPIGSRDKIDSLISIKDYKIVLEFKIGGFKKIQEGIVQANGYKEETNSDGIVSILFPKDLRTHVDSAEMLKKILAKTRIEYICLTPFLNDFGKDLTISDFANKLIESSESEYLQLNAQSIVKILSDSVNALAILLEGVNSSVSKKGQ